VIEVGPVPSLNMAASRELRRDVTGIVVVDMQYADASPDHGFNVALERCQPGSAAYINDRLRHTTVPEIGRLLTLARQDPPMLVVFAIYGSHERSLSDMPIAIRQRIRTLEQRSGVADIFWRGARHAAVLADVAPHPGDLVLAKTTFSLFADRNAEQLIRRHDVDNLVFAGVSTSCCVESSFRGAVDHGFVPYVVDAACADYSQELHERSLQSIAFNFGGVLANTREVADRLT
jgi:biuret amidohydrolase